MRYFIGVIVPNKERVVFDRLRREFHPSHRLSSPSHVTIVPPFSYDDEEEVLRSIDMAVQQLEPFRVRFEDVGSFRQLKYGTVFLYPYRVDGFMKIRDVMCSGIRDIGVRCGGEYIPHLSVAQKVPLDMLDDVKSDVRDMRLKLDMIVDRVSVFIFDDRLGSWSEFKQFVFASDLDIS